MKGAIFQYFFYRDKKNRPLKKGPFLKRPFFPRKLPLEKGPFLKRPFFPTTIQWTIYRQYSTYTNLSLGPVDRGSLYRYKMLSLNNIGDSFLLTTLIEAFTGAACDIVGVIIVRVARHLFDLRHWKILAW
jgi:hypothetical protein